MRSVFSGCFIQALPECGAANAVTYIRAAQFSKESVMSLSETKPQEPMAGQFLTFFIAGEEYATTILKIREVVEFDTITVVPNTPAWIRGVINLRGSVLPVVDLAVKFGLPPSTISKFTCVVVAEVASGDVFMTMGMLADSVSQVIEFTAKDVEEPPPFGTRVKIEYLRGMGRMGKKFCQILDIDKVLSADEFLAATGSIESAELHETPSSGAQV
jgi:purine-binding chemotaxis protein CheW